MAVSLPETVFTCNQGEGEFNSIVQSTLANILNESTDPDNPQRKIWVLSVLSSGPEKGACITVMV